MSIIAIDPGNERSAIVSLVDDRPDMKISSVVANGEALYYLRCWRPPEELLCIEMIASYGMPVGREVFETCVWIGRFVEAWNSRGGAHRLVYRKDVKLHLCGSPRANDANIRAALIDLYGPGKEKAIGTKKAPGPLYGIKADMWAALAVAHTALASA